MEEDDDEGYTHRATNSLKRAVYSGALSVAGYYERSLGLRRAAASGTDTGSSRTTGQLVMKVLYITIDRKQFNVLSSMFISYIIVLLHRSS